MQKTVAVNDAGLRIGEDHPNAKLTDAEVERIRGVQAGEALRALLERGLLKVVGRSDQPGRPLLYGTTERFLTVYGLKNLEDLPSPADLKRL